MSSKLDSQEPDMSSLPAMVKTLEAMYAFYVLV